VQSCIVWVGGWCARALQEAARDERVGCFDRQDRLPFSFCIMSNQTEGIGGRGAGQAIEEGRVGGWWVFGLSGTHAVQNKITK